ncbi:MAG: YciI family protein [Saprospiraceae bacterium]
MTFRITSTLLTTLLFFVFSCQSPTPPPTEETTTENAADLTYDSLKAQQYGADDYGMKKYVFAFLKRGPSPEQDSTKAADLQAAHMANIKHMAAEGQLVLAGPFFGNDSLRGIYLFNVQTIAEAEALTATDPLIQSGGLVMDMKEWYGSAALMAVSGLHEEISKIKM